VLAKNRKENMSDNTRALKPRPSELPAVIEDWQRFLKSQRNINDYVEDVHRDLVEDDQYRAYLYACWDEQAVEGSLSADNTMAAKMIRDKAVEMDPEHMLAKEKLATISKSLGVVLRRYHASRKQRREMVGGEIVPDANNVIE
jgi:hypothetical protein